MTNRIEAAPGAWLYPGFLDPARQAATLAALRAVIAQSPLFSPTMPRTGKPFSVRMTNCGALGWVSDRDGYRYQPRHPVTGAPWPAIPAEILAVWTELLPHAPPPEACLVNYYDGAAKMGLHQDRDERALDVPVLSISLGDEARFRIGGPTRNAPTRAFTLRSGDVFAFGAESRLAFHGVDRISLGTSSLLPEGGRLNLTLRRVTPSARS
ncbi:MAG: alpha-ketoglutarate-dependent dioxygenase AlkB [Pseudomonadota bacterium]|nr:alpha-ketoglutarate-dependent dioxygenase AlkB [Pseudomonadota bacterium]